MTTKTEATRWEKMAKDYCNLMLKYQGERDEAIAENEKLKASRRKLAKMLVDVTTEWSQVESDCDEDEYLLASSEYPLGDKKTKTKEEAIQSWIKWSEEE